jgi:hypothetical protein
MATRSGGLFGLFVFLFTTVGEWTALTVWRSKLAGGEYLWANIALLLGFASERGAVAVWLRKVGASSPATTVPSPRRLVLILIGATIVEIAIWYGWRAIAADFDAEIAALFLFITIHWLHVREIASVRDQPMIMIAFQAGPLLVSLCETLGATLWITFDAFGHPWLGRAALLIGFAVEHTLQGKELLRAVPPG